MSFGVMDIEVPCEILDSKSRMLGSRDTRDGTPSSVVEEYLLGELAPRTRQVVGEIVALGVLATLEARMGFEGKGERVCSKMSTECTILYLKESA